MDRASDCESEGWKFESSQKHQSKIFLKKKILDWIIEGVVAQFWLERWTVNPKVAGSSPVHPARFKRLSNTMVSMLVCLTSNESSILS